MGLTHSPISPTPDPRERSKRDLVAMAASVAPFHTAVNASPGEPAYHDSSACPYGKEITRDGLALAGEGGRRRCEWCEAHALVKHVPNALAKEETG
jgi:hypothetical protein